MGFNSAFKGLKLLKNPGNGRLNSLNDPVLNVLSTYSQATPRKHVGHALPATSYSKFSSQNVSESSVTIPDLPPLPTCTTL